MRKLCTIEDCGKRHQAKGYCAPHYHQYCQGGKGLKRGGKPGNQNNFKHGLSHTKIYSTWKHMKARCDNPNDSNYDYYGGRGITYCPEWSEFLNFYRDMGDKPEGYSIDRINNDGNYERGNCRWATPSEQVNNRRPFKRRSKHDRA